MSGLTNAVVAGGAWGVLLFLIGRRRLAEVLEDFYASLRRDCEPERLPPPERKPPLAGYVSCEQRRLPTSVVTVARPARVRTPTVEELEQWVNAPSAPEPEWGPE